MSKKIDSIGSFRAISALSDIRLALDRMGMCMEKYGIAVLIDHRLELKKCREQLDIFIRQLDSEGSK